MNAIKLNKISVINFSHRIESKTISLLNPFIKGVQSKLVDCEVNIHHLIEWNFSHCKGCLECWYISAGSCVHKDTFSNKIVDIIDSDLIIFSGPIWGGMANHLYRNFTLRLFCFLNPFFEKVNEHYGHRWLDNVKFKHILLFSTCSLPGLNNFAPLISHLKSFEITGVKLLESVLRPQARELEVLSNEQKEYLEQLCFNAGEEFANKTKISRHVLNRIAKTIMDSKTYMDFVNEKVKNRIKYD